MKHSGTADLKLMGGSIPPWLFDRMVRLSLPIVEAIVIEGGRTDFLRRLSDPFWFQSFGSVIGMDWNSSGVTTAVVSALKKALNPHSRTLGLFVCGGKGRDSLSTPFDLIAVGDRTGLDGDALARASRLTAKVDNTAVQDGFQIYLHSFVVSSDGEWSVIQQGMQPKSSVARRYHWHSDGLESFVNEPHTAVCGENQGEILNLTAAEADKTRGTLVSIASESPDRMIGEIRKLTMPTRTDIEAGDIDLKRLAGVLRLAHESQTSNFEELLLLRGLGPRTLQSLTLVSEVIYGTPSRFSDPARFAFAHGSKGGRPFRVPTRVYDETIETLSSAVAKAKVGESDRQLAIKSLAKLAEKAEEGVVPDGDFDAYLEQERAESWKYGGRTLKGFVKPPEGG